MGKLSVVLLSILFANEYPIAVNGVKISSGCILPPKPTHGDYITDAEGASPGDLLSSVVVLYTCDPGHTLVGPYEANCHNGSWDVTPYAPECIPDCKIENDTSIITCAAEMRCSIPESYRANSVLGRSDRLSSELNCGTPSASSTVIAGGDVAQVWELPWHSAIYTKTTKPYMQICGGSLVTTTQVISAAHCFWSDVYKLLPAGNYAAAFGKRYRPWSDSHDHSQHSDIAEIKVPPRFRGAASNFQDDLALVLLSTAVQYNFYVKPVCLDFDRQLEEQQLQSGNLGKVGGWGLTASEGPPSPVLKVAQLPYVDIARCIDEAPPSFVASITSDKICAGYNNGTAVCRGDSGGGLAFESEGRYYLRGVVSSAPSDNHACNTHERATFTLLSKHRAFIEDCLGTL